MPPASLLVDRTAILFPHPCNSLPAPCNSPHALKGQKLLAQGIRPGYLCPHAWRSERAKALYDLRPALSPVSVSLSPVFGVIAGFCIFIAVFGELSPVKFVITPLYSYFYPFLFYVPAEGSIPIPFPFLGGIHHGVDFLA